MDGPVIVLESRITPVRLYQELPHSRHLHCSIPREAWDHFTTKLAGKSMPPETYDFWRYSSLCRGFDGSSFSTEC